MTTSTVTAWLAELVEALSTDPASEAGEATDNDRLDELLAHGLMLDVSDPDGVTPELLAAALAALAAAQVAVSSEIAAVHRERIDVHRTVKAITAYVKALA